MQRTLAIIKPDAVRQKSIGEVIKRLEAAGFRIVGMKMVHLTPEKAGAFYAVHKERPFYKSLIQFMTPSVITRIQPKKGWVGLNFRELWKYRELLYFLIWRDLKVRYKQTALGAGWAIIQPLLTMLVFSIFFGRLAHGR